ncbi:MAG: HNH endonuclease family protein, partial [Gemmataceae bacterium]
ARVLNPPEKRVRLPAPRLHSHRLINKAASISAERVQLILASAGTVAGKVEELNRWVDFISENALVVMLYPANSLGAFQMFKTLNDRAQRTTQADMIKSHLFEHADDKIDEAQAKWSATRTIIEGVAVPGDEDPLMTYLHNISILEYGPIGADDIFEQMENHVTSRASSMKFLESLAASASDYAAIATPTHPKWVGFNERVKTSVVNISQEVKMTFIRPLMLAVATRFDPGEVHRAFRMFESWVIRFLIAGGSRSGATIDMIGKAAKEVSGGKMKTASQIAEMVKGTIPNDTTFHAAFCKKMLNKPKQARFLLRELEAQVRTGEPDELLSPVPDTDKLNLEHLLPKNPGPVRGWDHFTQDERKTFCHRLGNFVLLNNKDNGAINDKPFAEKRPVIEKSKHIWLTNDVITRTEKSKEWTKEDIDERQVMLADLAIKRWPLTIK